MLVIFWFQPYSDIQVTLVASLTKCKPVLINLCLLNLLCLKRLKKEMEQCYSYLYNVTRFSSIDLHYREIITVFAYDSLIYELSMGNCGILKFSSLPTEFHISYYVFCQRLGHFRCPSWFIQFCRSILIPKHSVDIQIKVTGNAKDMNIVEQYVHFTENNFHKNRSEPRLEAQYKWNSSINDSSLELTFLKFLTNSQIELIIHSAQRKLRKYHNHEKFALDYELNRHTIIVNAQLPSSFLTGSSLIFLKWNNKTLYSNASLVVDLPYFHLFHHELSSEWKNSKCIF